MDATASTLAAINDPARFERVAGVPIFAPHVRRHPDGRVKYAVTAADLAGIAAATDAPIRAGNLGRVTPGHVFPHVADKDLPTPLGFFANVRAGTFGPGSQPGILADVYCRKEHAAEFKRYPYRSAEYYPAEKRIRGLAMLVRDPALDLGTTLYSAPTGCEFYFLETAMDETLPPPGPADAAAAGDETALFERCATYLVEQGYIQPKPADAAATPPAAGGPADAGVMLQHDGGAAGPVVARLQRQVADQQAALARLAADRDRADCESLVTTLVAEGYQLDPAYEVAALTPLSPAARVKYADNVRRHYQAIPTGPFGPDLYQAANAPNAANRPLTKPQLEAAVARMSRTGETFAASKAAVLAGQA